MRRRQKRRRGEASSFDSVMAIDARTDKAKPMDGSQQRTSGAATAEALPATAALRRRSSLPKGARHEPGDGQA